MEFDKNRVFTALNADELKVGSRVIVADTLEVLKLNLQKVNNINDALVFDLIKIGSETDEYRFETTENIWQLAYLISEPEEKKLKWTDLKIGDVVKCKIRAVTKLVTGIDESAPIDGFHILLSSEWVDDRELESWKKVEE